MKKIVVLLLISFVLSSVAFSNTADSAVTKVRATFVMESLTVSKDAMVSWTCKNEQGSLPFIVEQFIYHQWVEVGRVNGVGSEGSNSYSIAVNFNSGENKFRVRQQGQDKINKFSTTVTYASKKQPLTFTIKGKNQSIEFSGETYYIVYNPYGVIVTQGLGNSIDISAYEKGDYSFVYDNKIGNFKK
jgi:hypothetical protein